VNSIIGIPNLLFLGAGASKPYGKLLMGEFIRSFRAKVEAGSKQPRVIPPVSSSPLLDAICNEREDLEFLIEELEALISRAYLGQQSFNPNPPGMGGTYQLRWPGLQEVASEARKLLASLKREVYLEYRSISDPTQTSILAKPISLLQADSQEPTVVFTTNYDPAVEKYCFAQKLRLIDGFTHDEQTQEYSWNRATFEERPSPGTLILFKLHGSANWHRDQGRIVKGLPTYDVGDPNYQNVMIYPATRKVATEDPFFTAYDYLEQCLDKADSCLVIGYSFRDYDTLMRFKSAKLSNRRLKIAVLDPAATSICEFLDGQGFTAFPIPFALGNQEPEYLPLITSGIR
jgi:hypothetical protein